MRPRMCSDFYGSLRKGMAAEPGIPIPGIDAKVIRFSQILHQSGLCEPNMKETSLGLTSTSNISTQKDNKKIQLLLNTAEKCLKAAAIDQLSLFRALSKLARSLRLCRGVNDDNGTICANDGASSEGEDDIISLGNYGSSGVESDVNNERMEETYRRVVLSLLQLDVVRTGSTLSSIQHNILGKIDECLDFCGLRMSFMVAVDIVHSLSSSRSNSLLKDEVLSLSDTESNNPHFCINTDVFPSIILSSSRLIRRLLTQHNNQNWKENLNKENQNHIHVHMENGVDEDMDINTSAGKGLRSFLNEYFSFSIYKSNSDKNKETDNKHSCPIIFHPQPEFSPQIISNEVEMKQLERKLLHFIDTILIVLPTQMANAFHSCHFKLPIWATRSNFFTQLIQSAASAATSSAVCSISSGHIRSSNWYTNRTGHANLDEMSDDGKGTQKQNEIIEIIYFAKLMEVLMRHGNSDDVSNGLYNFWKQYIALPNTLQSNNDKIGTEINDNDIGKVAKFVLQSVMMKLVSSPRCCAILIRSLIKKIISEIEIYPLSLSQSKAKNICEEECIPFLRDVNVLGILSLSPTENEEKIPIIDNDDDDNDEGVGNESNDKIEAFINLMILSPSPTGDLIEQKLMTRCVVELLAACNRNCQSISSDGTLIYKKDRIHYSSVLMRHLLEVVNVWNHPMFINDTDTFQQRHVSSFILDAMDYMQKEISDNNSQENIIEGLVIGITNRLEVSEISVRQDGMLVAEKLAPMLGEDLKFDELDDVRDEDIVERNSDKRDDKNGTSDQIKNIDPQHHKKSPQSRKVKKKKFVEIDPDEEYFSDEDSSESIENASTDSSDNSSSFDDDSEWGEENLVPFHLSDDEEDLRPVPKPNYLQECLTLLRASEDDNEAKYMQEAALTEVTSLVRDLPPDLLDIAAPLTKELLFIENRYNTPSFSEFRWDGLCALAVCAPMSTIPCLQEQLFADIALNLRLDILEIMKYSSTELCGQVELDKSHINRQSTSIEPSTSVNLEKVTENMKTRRWGRGRQHYKTKIVSNKFGELSPLFFYPLIQGFVESKENQVLWGGENGGRLLSSLLVALSTFVECSGKHPGSSVLSSDLFDLSWSFQEAENPEVRLSVLISVATCLPRLTPDSLANVFYTHRLPNVMQRVKEFDTNRKCRELASLIFENLVHITDLAVI